MSDDPIQLGDTYRDRLTGFTGLAVAHTRYLGAEERALIQPKGSHDRMPRGEWLDVSRLDHVAGDLSEGQG